MRPEIDQLAPVVQVLLDQLRGDRGKEDLSALGLAAEPSGEADRGADVVRTRALRLTGVDAEASRDVEALGPLLGDSARVAATAASSAPSAESNTEMVDSPSPIDLRNRPPRRSTQSAISSSLRTSASAIAAGSESHSSAALDVRETERDHARWQCVGPARPKAFDEFPGRRRPARGVGRHPQANRGFELVGLCRIDSLPGRQHAGGCGTGQQRERRRRERVDIAGARRRAIRSQLRRSEARRAHPPTERVRGRRDAEIDQLDPPARRQDQVCRLDVAMDDRRTCE